MAVFGALCYGELAEKQSEAGGGMTTRVGSVGGADTVPSLGGSLLRGGLGFGLVSLCVFATVAFAERWMYAHLGMLGAYLGWTALFILLGGGVLGSLVVGRCRLPRFYLLFGLAFFSYAAGLGRLIFYLSWSRRRTSCSMRTVR